MSNISFLSDLRLQTNSARIFSFIIFFFLKIVKIKEKCRLILIICPLQKIWMMHLVHHLLGSVSTRKKPCFTNFSRILFRSPTKNWLSKNKYRIQKEIQIKMKIHNNNNSNRLVGKVVVSYLHIITIYQHLKKILKIFMMWKKVANFVSSISLKKVFNITLHLRTK